MGVLKTLIACGCKSYEGFTKAENVQPRAPVEVMIIVTATIPTRTLIAFAMLANPSFPPHQSVYTGPVEGMGAHAKIVRTARTSSPMGRSGKTENDSSTAHA